MTTALAIISMCSTIAVTGTFLFKSHLRAVANDWKEIAEARAVKIDEKDDAIAELEAKVKQITMQTDSIIRINKSLIGYLAEYVTRYGSLEGYHSVVQEAERYQDTKTI